MATLFPDHGGYNVAVLIHVFFEDSRIFTMLLEV